MHTAFPVRLAALAVCLALLGIAAPATHGQGLPASADFFFQDGDTPAVFLGDSITEQRMYTTLIETYALTRFPDRKMTFRNAGWAGDTAWLIQRGEAESGFQRDVGALHPKAVLIEFGMNDARGGDANYSKYLEAISERIQDAKKAGARVVIITPTPEEGYQADVPAGSAYNVELKKYADGLKLVADNENVQLIDQFTPFVEAIKAGRKAGVLTSTVVPGDPNVVRLVNPDGVHPNWGGHFVMATTILEALRATDMVSSVTVDAAAQSITAAQGCTIEWESVPKVPVQFKRTDDIMPWPIAPAPEIDQAMKIPGFDPATKLNRYELTVTGLPELQYTLTIDDQIVGTYTSADLAKGLNLGFVRQGPIYTQGQQLLKAVMDKNDAYYERWRNVQLYSFSSLPEWLRGLRDLEDGRAAELARLDKVIADAETEIATLRRPVPHVFKLLPVAAIK